LIISLEKTKKARVNRQIHVREMRLIGSAGEQVGIVSLDEALRMAEAEGLDLVEISPQTTPPVCRIMDYGKYLFEQSKRLKKKSKQIQTKEIKLRPTTDIGDYQVKMRKATEFLQAGDKVKITIRFRGREMAYQDLGRELLARITHDLMEHGTAEQMPKMEGKQLTMILAPAKAHN